MFKDSTYRPEQEVRFVIKVDPRQASVTNGVSINASQKTIIDKVYYSPVIPGSEKLNLETFVYQKRFSRAFFPAGQEPKPWPIVPEPDLPPGLFSDLD